jgi:hypothetical protein
MQNSFKGLLGQKKRVTTTSLRFFQPWLFGMKWNSFRASIRIESMDKAFAELNTNFI